MLKTKSFYLLWMMFIIGALAGLMVIGNVQNFAKSPTDGFTAHGFSVTDAGNFAVLGAAMCLPIFNGAGRIVWGQVSDKIGTTKSTPFHVPLPGCYDDCVLLHHIQPILLLHCRCLNRVQFWWKLRIVPRCNADSFGAENLGLNYGFIFTAYGIGGIVGPLLAGGVQDAGMSFLYAFIPAAIMCFIAAVLALIYKDSTEKKSA